MFPIKIRQIFSLISLMVMPLCALPQTKALGFILSDKVAVKEEGKELSFPWVGGLNSIQFNKMDLDMDGQQDLVLFDRHTHKVTTFLWLEDTYIHQPAYESLFPDINGWMILADYNCDGKKDIFTTSQKGVIFFQNLGGTVLAFGDAMIIETTNSLGNPTALSIDGADIPAIVDLDSDGDLDILTFAPSIGTTVELHLNLQVENELECGSLTFRKENTRWGEFSEGSTCGEYYFDSSESNESNMRPAAVKHGGSTLLVLDLNGDNQMDLLLGEVDCDTPIVLLNEGTSKDAIFTEVTVGFPIETPADLPVFPASFYEDIDGDGVRDLLLSPNIESGDNALGQTDFAKSSFYYKNTGTEQSPVFELTSEMFLQSEMVDVGEFSMPALGDVDADGDTDLLISSYGRPDGNGVPRSTIYLYLNVGSDTEPEFELQTKDWLEVSSLGLIEVQIQLVDLNKNGVPDLAFSGREPNTSNSMLRYVINQAEANQPYEFDLSQVKTIDFTIRPQDYFYFYDIDKDGEVDILRSLFSGFTNQNENSGTLEYHRNTGNLSFTKVTDAFLGITDDKWRSPMPLIHDFDGNGTPDMLIGTAGGKLVYYENALSDINSAPSGRQDLVTLKENQPLGLYGFGKNLVPTILENNLWIGSAGGGLFLLEKGMFEITGIPELPERVKLFKAYPVPTSQTLTIQSNSKLPLTGQIYSASGNSVLNDITLSSFGKVELDVASWVKGLYLLKMHNEEGGATIKILIQ
ncbi:FG-GAP-like repeat-containing protein [Limibacter armeniacum]|uniref:T9SS type A sorting domain-containing protein n=1 Tax=Limibacter armeniacum TaxID=466084 RepID=UPI002FE66EA4